MTTVGFTTIVKNEAHVVTRALASVLPIVDYVLISDTGSTDDTPRVIRSWLQTHGIPGEVMERPWVDFSHNRNEALERLSEKRSLDYVLTIDADEYLVFDPGFDIRLFKDSLDEADAWRVTSRVSSQKFDRLQLFSNHKGCHFRYRIHEKLTHPGGIVIGRARGFFNQYTFDGARMRNPNKYLDDARVIEEELASGVYDSDPSALERYTYYLAQCFNWGREYKKALEAYRRQTQMTKAEAHAASSYFNMAVIMERLGENPESIIATYLQSYGAEPLRAEPLCGAARIANMHGWHQKAYEFAGAASNLPEPDAWTIDTAAYEWRGLDQLLLACIGTRRFAEAVEVAERLLAEAKFPESERERIEKNAAYALAQYDLAPSEPVTSAPVP